MSLGALGMIETFGLVAAVEGLDASLKAANVTLSGFKYVSGGLVTFFVTGDTGAVRAAISAGESAANKIGKVISTHVIPRPAESTSVIAAPMEKPAGRKKGTGIHKREFPAKVAPTKAETAEPAPKPEPVSEPIVTAEETREPEVSVVETVEPEVVVEEAKEPEVLTEPEALEGSEAYTYEQLQEIKTTELRKMAREIPNIGLTKIEIRDAKKEPLIEAILKAQNNNG